MGGLMNVQHIWANMIKEYKYKTLKEFRESYPKEVIYLINNRLIRKFCEDMGWRKIKDIKPKGYWNKERCIEEAKKYKTRVEWYNDDLTTYRSAKKNGWFDECTEHMVEINKPKGYWTKELCLLEALKYKTIKEWTKNSQTSYCKSIKFGWLNECTTHMLKKNKLKNYWTKERCIEDALKYKTKTEWTKKSTNSRNSAMINGWCDECTKHMVEFSKPKGYWNKERCIEDALKYKTIKEWTKNSCSSLHSSIKNGWYYECTAHMFKIKKQNGYWTKERCMVDALKYKSRNEWQKTQQTGYQSASKNGWVDECTKHMI